MRRCAFYMDPTPQVCTRHLSDRTDEAQRLVVLITSSDPNVPQQTSTDLIGPSVHNTKQLRI